MNLYCDEYYTTKCNEQPEVMIYNCFISEPFIDLDRLQTKVTELEQTTRVTHHTEEQSKEVISLILPFLQLSLLSLRVVETLEKRKDKLPEILNDEKWAELDVATGSSKLKQACAMLMLGHTDTSLEKLVSILHDGIRRKCPLCDCYDYRNFEHTFIITGVSLQRRITMVKKLLCDLYQPCVVFLPNECRITPLAVNYERTRYYAYGRSPHLTVSFSTSRSRSWCYWGVVEGIFLTQFLLYMNYKALGQESQATKACADRFWGSWLLYKEFCFRIFRCHCFR